MSGISPYGVTVLIIGLAVTCACSQIKPPDQGTSTVYVGSTPCDSIIFSLLQIPTGEICEFIKWNLNLKTSGNPQFQLTALYGESQPNTNGFKGGGNTIQLSGHYKFEKSKNGHPNSRIYILNCDQLQEPLLLMAMDENILHFTDPDKKLLVGNGGWGYVLNKIISN